MTMTAEPVARLSYATAMFHLNGRHRRLVSAVVNRPITTGDKLWSDNALAADCIWLPPRFAFPATPAFFLNLRRTTQIRITEGVITCVCGALIRMKLSKSIRHSLLDPSRGNYKIDVNEPAIPLS